MKKIFITVGTTPFDELIKFCDQTIDTKKFNIFAQISPYAKYKPLNFEYIEYTQNIDEYYNNYDLIISHAGAGSVYKLLELNKKTIFVPNYTMKDDHQIDICNFIEKKNYALVMKINQKDIDINKTINESFNSQNTTYEKEKTPMSLSQEIYSILRQ